MSSGRMLSDIAGLEKKLRMCSLWGSSMMSWSMCCSRWWARVWALMGSPGLNCLSCLL